MNKHTPGPWKVTNDFHDDDESLDYMRIVTDGCVVASTVIEDDAHLIAAAPELLEALECLFDSYKALADSGDAGNWRLEDQPDGIKALAAIAKARGEA